MLDFVQLGLDIKHKINIYQEIIGAKLFANVALPVLLAWGLGQVILLGK